LTAINLLILTQYYPPEIGAPQARLSELAQGLSAQGMNITVLTSMPNYPQGRVYPGYRGLVKFDKSGVVKIIRTAIIPSQKTALLPRLLSYFSFIISSFFFGSWFVGKTDFILTESPPLFLGINGYLLSKLKKAKWIFNVSDLWPESAVRLGAVSKGWGLSISYWLEAFFYRKAWLVTGQSQSILGNIQKRFPQVKTYHLSNGVDIELFSFSQSAKQYIITRDNEEQLVLLYGGLHGIAQGLDQLILAAKELDQENVKFYLVGDGPEKKKLLALAKNLQLENVHFIDPVEKLSMPALLAAADICIIPLKVYLPGAVPSKLYEAMASQRPVILIAEGEAAKIVEEARCGLTIQPGNIAGIVESIICLQKDSNLRKEMGRQGRKVVEKSYNRKRIVEGFSRILMKEETY